MPRATNGPASRKRRRRILEQAKGFRGSRRFGPGCESTEWPRLRPSRGGGGVGIGGSTRCDSNGAASRLDSPRRLTTFGLLHFLRKWRNWQTR